MPTFPELLPFRRDRLGLVLLGLCLLHLGLLAPALVYPDLNLDYPFVDGDSPEWIAAGLRLAGHDVRDPGRSPLLPLAIALLDRLGALPWLPVALQVLFHATVLAFYGLAARRGARRAAFAVSLALLLSHSLHGMSLQVMADVPASCLLFLAGRSFVLRLPSPGRGAGGEGSNRYPASGLLGGLSALTQAAGLLAAVPAALTVLLHRRGDLRSGRLWVGALLFIALQALWIVLRLEVFGSVGHIAARQWDLIDPDPDSVFFYLYSLVSLLGLPGVLLLGAGLALGLRAARRDDDRFFWLTLFAVLALFFVVFYGFDAKRFLVYLVWPAGLFIADGLGRLRAKPAFATAAGLLIAGSALPFPGEGNDPSWIGLWPVPPVYLHAALTARPSGSPVLEPSGITVETFPPEDLLGFINLGRAWRARKAWAAAPRPERLDPAQVVADHTALFLYEAASDGGGRHRTLSRLSNALFKRVKFVPAAWLEPWAAYLEIERAGVIEPDYAVFRTRLPDAPGSWLLVTPLDGALRRRWDGRVGQPSRPADPALRPALARAREIRRGLPETSAVVVLFPGNDPADFYLPFLLDTPDLILVEPEQERAVRGQVSAAPLLSERRVAGAEIREIEILGRRTAVVELTKTAAPHPTPPPPRPPGRRSPPARRAAGRPAG
ncbi:MAG TPA: hypothetical protein VKM72_03870 [Thermoanaerobaculia bacterium]|nr:hypothetical protein [Thermoanaerobaculia bacterium]